MAVVDLFHRREEDKVRAGQPDVYQYDHLPLALRMQVTMIIQAVLGPWGFQGGYATSNWHGENWEVWDVLDDVLRKELALPRLSLRQTPESAVLALVHGAETPQALGAIEVIFRSFDRSRRHISLPKRRSGFPGPQSPEEAIAELNVRFRQHGVGYQYHDGRLIRLDEDFTHDQIVLPALTMLAAPEFAAADQHFRKALECYRDDEPRQAMAEALSAVESSLKAIFDRRHWQYDKNATMKPLLDLAFREGLLPSSEQSFFGGLRTQLESGLPTAANPNRHGQSTPRTPPEYLVRFALQQAASSITLIVERDRLLA